MLIRDIMKLSKRYNEVVKVVKEGEL